MFLRFVNSTIIASLLLSSFVCEKQAQAAYITTDTIYQYASNNQRIALLSILRYGYSIDMMDAYGNTALCQAILNEDGDAIQNLLDFGANRNANCLNQISSDKLYRVGLLDKRRAAAVSARSGRASPPLAAMVWNNKGFLALGIIAAVALSAGGGGGGGGNSVPTNPAEEEKTILQKISKIEAITQSSACPNGMVLINGVCTKRVLSTSRGDMPVSVELEDGSPAYLAEFGGIISSPVDSVLDFSGDNHERIVAMQANGVSVQALSQDGLTVDVEKASLAVNTKGTDIKMTENSEENKGVIGMYATAAGTIQNNGNITVISESENESAAMKSDRLISSTGVPGTGANLENNGVITVIDNGNDSGTLSAISAPGRGITNNGNINLKLNTTREFTSTKGSGTVQGMYGKNLVNKGIINLEPNLTPQAIHSEVFLMRGFGDQGSIVANDGTLNIGLTNVADGIKGVWSDATNNVGVTIKNTGTINVEGTLYNTHVNPTSKQVYLLGSEGGIAETTNYGTIQVGLRAPVEVSYGGILNAMNGANGILYNENLLDFHLYADPSVSTNAFTAQAMSLANGEMVNNKEINFSFDNTKDTIKSNAPIRLTAMESYASDPTKDNYATLTNNGKITAAVLTGEEILPALTGSAGSGFFAAMKSSNGALTNTGSITAASNMDNLDLVGLQSETGSISNDSRAEIILQTTGYNANLIGGYSEGDDAGKNTGYIYLKHNGGSGDITGFGAGNNGLIQIEANDMVGESYISGGVAYAPVYEKPEDPIGQDITESETEIPAETQETPTEEEPTEEVISTAETATKKAKGATNILLTGTTSGVINGFEYENGNPKGITTHHSANTINITTQSPTRDGDLEIYGLYTGPNTQTYRDGVLTINALGNATDKTEIFGLYAENADLTNEKTSVVNLNLNLNNSTEYFVSGMTLVDTSIVQYIPDLINPFANTRREQSNGGLGYKAYNAGTININVTGTTSAVSHFDTKIPFDVVGMLTNSYALNTGTIKIGVSETPTGRGPKVAGMVAYDGGVIANQGTIIFSGNPNNFTPLYATGNNRVYNVEYPSQDTTVTTTKDYYATIYNSGRIITNRVIEPNEFIPYGEGYHQKDYPTEYINVHTDPWQWDDLTTDVPAEDAWAREWKVETKTVTTKETQVTNEEGETETKTETQIDIDIDAGETYSAFDEFDNPLPTPVALTATAPVAKTADASTPTEQPITKTKSRPSTQADLSTTDSYNLRINDGMQYVSELGGSFEAEGAHLIGDITAGQTLVLNGNKDVYIGNGFGEGALIGDGNSSDLSLASNSVLFNASYGQNKDNKNGLDIVMTRKSFHELVDNASLASYLESNYKLGNNEALFNQLKSHSNLSALTGSLNQMTAKGMMSRFNFEDMSLMRELNYNLNESIFHAKEPILSVAGDLNPVGFKGSSTAQSKYSLLNKKSKNMSIGLGVAYTKINSDHSDSANNRQETVYQMVVPMNFSVGQLNLMTSPRLGYAYTKYERTGLNNQNYRGDIEKRVYGLMNEARYPLHVGTWLIEPAVEFNLLGYTQKGREDVKDFSLSMKSQDTYSVESGVGLYLTNEQELGKDEHLKVSIGAAAYHEFADPYKLDIGMTGMQGTFTLDNQDYSTNHAITRFGIDYVNQNYSLYGAFTSYWDKETNSLFKSGLKMNF